MSHVFVGTGHDLPPIRLSNDDLEALVGAGYDRARSGKSLDEWSMERIGVRVRYHVPPGEGASDMAARAARRALDDAGLRASDLDLIVLSTFTSDYRTPNTAGLLQGNLGIKADFVQIDAACPGFVQATVVAAALLDRMGREYALVVSTDVLSPFFRREDFMKLCLFGDGAGAVILRRTPDSRYGLKAEHSGGDGSMGKVLWIPGGGSKEPITSEMVAAGRQYGIWDNKAVYPFAVQRVVECSRIVAARAGWTMDEVDWFIPHQAGRNILLDAARLLGVPEEKFVINIDHTGNTSGASIPIALDEMNRAGKLKDGQKIILPAMGAGLAWGALAVVWHDYRSGPSNR